ncbi:helix-turn-helix domain-containing protein [Halapricum desulfuricans]|uniref:Transcriptional regulator, TrmB family n=1 Tax=Halapricum desulfuricans TaxID=2841257 RepID=A0A897NFI7_9EURY|nr:MarR family transcriptional regulator [Halapricum desulfuricans]QSG09773.1 Transcriptional regulator, TrmB family [Halapricum desulfuricans]QSG11140.1 Transcriptional regulator, TrmB family [Halapricum desulfuricans]
MPISADRFDEIDDDSTPTPGTNAHEILSFLEANADQAFTRSEIAESTGVADGSVGPTLVRLREAGRVDHRGHYWRVSDHVRSVTAATGHADAVATSHEDEPIAYDEWQDYAVDPREDRD